MRFTLLLSVACLVTLVSAGALFAQAQQEFKPEVGQAGKDVVWVPTSEALVEKMLDMARVTPQDFVMDLGSGDGRNIIAAAKRGARATGVEFNPEMVLLSRRNAASAGVAERATFVEGDMFEADFSQATVLALFLLPDNLLKLRPKFFAMKPGTRIVMNTFAIPEWQADVTEQIERDCQTWCTSLLYYVPAKVEGTWRLPQGELTLTQTYQMVTGSLASGGSAVPIVNGRLRGDQISFSLGGSDYTGRVNGDTMEGVATAGGQTTNWTAARAR
jgi:precorrin-6B methylase 2